MRYRGKRLPQSEQRSARDVVGASALPEELIPADMRPYRLTDWRSDQRRQNRIAMPRDKGWSSYLHGTAGGNGGPAPQPFDLLPIDLHPRRLEEYARGPNGQLVPSGADIIAGQSPLDQYVQQIARDTRDIASTQVIERGLIARVVVVPTTPVLVADAQFLRGYIFLNPAETAGLTTAGTFLAPLLRTATGTSSSLGVANFLNMHLFLDVTAAAGGPGTLTIVQQALDPVTLTWFDVQTLFTVATAAAPTSIYTYPADFGTATDMRLSWTITGGGSFTFSVGFVLKNGLAGTSSGVNQTVFIGSAGVTTQTGFPLLEGQREKFFLRENTQLFAVASSTLQLNVFEL